VQISYSILESEVHHSFRTPVQTLFRTPVFLVVFRLRTPFRTSSLFLMSGDRKQIILPEDRKKEVRLGVTFPQFLLLRRISVKDFRNH
jgi:hypothetical protein